MHNGDGWGLILWAGLWCYGRGLRVCGGGRVFFVWAGFRCYGWGLGVYSGGGGLSDVGGAYMMWAGLKGA